MGLSDHSYYLRSKLFGEVVTPLTWAAEWRAASPSGGGKVSDEGS